MATIRYVAYVKLKQLIYEKFSINAKKDDCAYQNKSTGFVFENCFQEMFWSKYVTRLSAFYP